jgi:hypothetical protein
MNIANKPTKRLINMMYTAPPPPIIKTCIWERVSKLSAGTQNVSLALYAV